MRQNEHDRGLDLDGEAWSWEDIGNPVDTEADTEVETEMDTEANTETDMEMDTEEDTVECSQKKGCLKY